MLTDESLMPFGKFKGKPLQDVSPSYLHWLWENSIGSEDRFGVLSYIERQMDAIKLEIPDKIWSKHPQSHITKEE